jgi:hypothetical protein
MNLKKRILINQLIFPLLLLFVLIAYTVNKGLYSFKESYGFFIFCFVLWFIISVIYISRSTNHLIKYTIRDELIQFTINKKFNTIYQIEIPINSIKSTNLETRNIDIGFDILKIKYLDEDVLYNLLELRISNKIDWITILSKIEKVK